MVGLHYLKYAYDMSDDGVLEEWLENPYWQYFLKGKEGDELNVIFAGCGFNIRKLFRAFALLCAWILEAIACDGLQYIYRFGKRRAREGNNLSLKGFSLS